MPQIGDEFRAARLARHLSSSEVSEQIHIRSVYLEAIENEEWTAIGAPVYVRGFIRTYARFLGLEPEAAVAYYNAESSGEGAVRPGPERRYSRRRARSGPSAWLWSAALAAAVLLGFVGYNFFELRGVKGDDKPLPTVPSPHARQAAFVDALGTNRPAAHPAPASTSSSSTLELRLTEASWVSVLIDGSKRLEGTFPAGTRKAFHGKLADIRTGNAGGVELTVNGKELGTMGHSGGIAERSIALAEE